MKALSLTAVGKLEYIDLPDPKPQKGEVLLKIKACGICGSDVPRVLTKGTYHFPTVVGHEFAGQITELGEGVHKKFLGRRATVFPLLPCFKCKMCEEQQYASCSDYNYFGSRCDGGFAEYLAVPIWNIVVADDNDDYEELAMTEPCAVALHALRNGGIASEQTVAIFGSGPIGMMMAQLVQIYGSTPLLIDVDHRKVDFARKLGFENVFTGSSQDAVQFVKDKTDGLGADICLEGAGFVSALENCLYSVKSFGRIVAMGNPAGNMDISQKAYWELLRKQATLVGTWNSGYEQVGGDNDWISVIKNISSGNLKLKELITHRYKLSDGRKPFDMMTSKKEFFNKVMYVMD
jgi:L-iditol 2-dehydrogenase